jgi:hypothetical protein
MRSFFGWGESLFPNTRQLFRFRVIMFYPGLITDIYGRWKVGILFNKSNISLANFHTLLFSCPNVKSQGTHLAQTRLMPNSNVTIWWTLSNDAFKLSLYDNPLFSFSNCSASVTAILGLSLQSIVSHSSVSVFKTLPPSKLCSSAHCFCSMHIL